MRGWAALVVGLALLTFIHTGPWASEEAVWRRARLTAPQNPTPLIGIAHVQFQRQRYEVAGWYLEAALEQPTRHGTDREWRDDAVEATRARIFLATGRLHEAARLMAAGPLHSDRWALCQHYTTVCALAASSP